jgi:small-conductance mechanosensitive channel
MRILALLLLLGLWLSGSEHAQAPVVVHGRQIVVLRATVAGFGPAERAEVITQRITDLLAHSGPGTVSDEAVPDGRLLSLDGTAVLLLVPDDAERVVGETLAATAEQARAALTEAVSDYRRPISTEAVTSAIIAVTVMTVIFLAVISALVWTTRWLRRTIGTRLKPLEAPAGHRDLSGLLIDQVGLLLRLIVTLAAWVGGALMTYVWLSTVLSRIPATRLVGEDLRGALIGLAFSGIGAITSAIPGLLVVLVIVLFTAGLAHIVNLFFRRVVNRRIQFGWLNSDTAVPTRRLATVALWLFAIAMAYPYLPGSGSEAFKGVSVLVGVMVSLGASGLVGQAASGFILTYLGTIRVGDYVKVGDTEGEVAAIGIFTTRIVTVFKEAVSVPNVLILTNQLVNYSRFPGASGVVTRTTVTIGYTVPWRQMHHILITAAGRVPDFAAEPAPYVLQRALQDFYVAYEVCAHLTDPKRRIPALARLHQEIQDLCNEEGIQILSPHWMQDPATPAIVPKAEWHRGLPTPS